MNLGDSEMPKQHQWQPMPGRVPSEVNRKRCTQCGLVMFGVRERVYYRDGSFWNRAGPCLGEFVFPDPADDTAAE